MSGVGYRFPCGGDTDEGYCYYQPSRNVSCCLPIQFASIQFRYVCFLPCMLCHSRLFMFFSTGRS